MAQLVLGLILYNESIYQFISSKFSKFPTKLQVKKYHRVSALFGFTMGMGTIGLVLDSAFVQSNLPWWLIYSVGGMLFTLTILFVSLSLRIEIPLPFTTQNEHSEIKV
eukprot:TRINITY_DN2145_c0_g1_i2.p1 TRINITY_DN2145_c0_g1~~TRINITY_DN2145_c0_g1_i2.p1  ORF type:complete len:108 (-),score=5.89 TRINITY_DN2145_c0_g1_i2:14-337(-)